MINLDETGMRINATRDWLHVAGTNKLKYYFPHKKRGSDAMNTWVFYQVTLVLQLIISGNLTTNTIGSIHYEMRIY
ncbi:MAG: transposase [Methanohalophilus sp. T328-1]|nr:MAG: transposase [Methanohalophilus sp. T328-1]